MRDMGSVAQAQLVSNYLRLGIFAELHFASSIEYVWTGLGSIGWNGQTWKGLGDLASLSAITEDSTLTAQGLTLTLAGIRNDLLVEALTEVQQGLPCRVYVVFFDSSGLTPIDSITCYAGRMDQPTIEEGVDSSTVSITVENRLSDLQRAPFRRLTDQDQRARYPTDTGLDFVNYLQDWNGSWGSN